VTLCERSVAGRPFSDSCSGCGHPLIQHEIRDLNIVRCMICELAAILREEQQK
jgi:hypothetical protein